ncbi:PDDEXK nuclease domain-containing protein [Rhodoferax antarcticus]|uniref:Cytoplasmic protein n=1 Tax=Rhodoferax antarcticus ANT.BR TaxID=1111071 RepID=A0A1Q8YAS2_9BURK|nr:hypothetical protein BLL52_3907 [Rhodoferax antarcticus ANT.BR]
MNEATILTATAAAPTPADNLHAELRSLIASSRQRLAGAVNAELTRLYWSVGKRLHTEVLGGADRAKYGDQLVKRVGEQLAQEFGRGFEAKNLRRMVQFALAFPDVEKVASLMRHLSWTHFLQLLPLKADSARWFYAQQIVESRWSVRELHHQIERKAFERTELASLQAPNPVRAEPVEASASTPAQVFKDPYFLDFLGLRQGHDEADLEAAILRQLEAFILELGRGFAFVERQKRMVIDGEDFYLDLLFYHRRLRRLVAVELKLGRFKAAHKGHSHYHWPNFVRRIQPRTSGAAANAQRRHHCGRILDRAAAQGGAEAAPASGFDRGARAAGEAGGVAGGG